jgi:hypothetical protein
MLGTRSASGRVIRLCRLPSGARRARAACHCAVLSPASHLHRLLRQARGMCLVLDIVLNHVQPVASPADVAAVSPFNHTSYYHTLRAAPGATSSSLTLTLT